MPQFVLNVVQPAGGVPAPAALARIMTDVAAVIDAAARDGALVLNVGLAPPQGSAVVRADAEGRTVTDGPYAEAKEFVGGFVMVRTDDRDGALAWAERLARATTLPIEVRQVAGGG